MMLMQLKIVKDLMRFLEKCEIDRPRGSTVFTMEEALEVANRLKYPVLVRPSYVLGGAGMEICLNDGDVKEIYENH